MESGRDSLSRSDLSHVTSVGEVVIARTHITVLPRLCDVEYCRTMQISSELTNLVVYLVRDEYHATLFLLANKHI